MEEEYEVEAVLDKDIDSNGGEIYKVKWRGYSESECTWEPIENLSSALHLVEKLNKSSS